MHEASRWHWRRRRAKIGTHPAVRRSTESTPFHASRLKESRDGALKPSTFTSRTLLARKAGDEPIGHGPTPVGRRSMGS